MELAIYVVPLGIVVALVLYFVLVPQDLVGEIAGARGPLGMLAVDVTLTVWRGRPRPGKPPALRIGLGEEGARFAYTLRAPLVKKAVGIFEKAAARAIQPPEVQAPFSGNPDGAPCGSVAGLRVGVVNDHGLGFVVITWSGGIGRMRSCFSPGDVEELVTMLRMASQPGTNLEAAERRYRDRVAP